MRRVSAFPCRCSSASSPTDRMIDVVLLVRDRELRTRRDGGEYLQLGAGRPHGLGAGVICDGVAEVARGLPGRLRRARRRPLRASHPRYGAQIAVRALRAAEPHEVDLDALLDGPPRSADADGGRPARARRHGPEPAPARAARRDLRPGTPTWERFRDAPAAKRYHQAYRHGLLEHSLSVAQSVSAISADVPGHRPRRRGHRRAAARHRQARRLHRRPALAIDLTDARQAAGRDPARLLPRPPPDRGPARLPRPTSPAPVLHIILSHHGALEHGSPVVPCTREATLVHMIDNLGGRLGSFDRLEKELPQGSALVGVRPRARRRRLLRRSPSGVAQKCANSRESRRTRPGALCRASPSTVVGRGEGHREADPAAVADLVPDGGAAARHRDRDPARRRGLLRHDRGRVRAPLLRRPRGARRARHPAARRQAGRRLLRAGELLARARGLPPPRDRVHRRRARRAADRADAARRRVRLRRAAAARAPADHLGPPEPARLAGAALDRRSASPASAGGAELSARLAKIDTAIYRRKRIEFEYFTMQTGETALRKRRPVPAAVRGRPVLPRRPLARARRRARLPALAHPRQGRLRHEGRARLPAPATTSTRASYANRIPWQLGDDARHRRDLGLRPHRLARRAQLRPLRRAGRRRRRRPRLPHRRTRSRGS